MKNYIVLLLLLLAFISCDSDETASEPGQSARKVINQTLITTANKKMLFAWLHNETTIKVTCKNSFCPSKETIEQNGIEVRSHGGVLQEYSTLGVRDGKVIIKFDQALDLNSNYEVTYGGQESHYAYLNPTIADQQFFYDGDDLGAQVVNGKLQVKFWSPVATNVQVELFRRDGETPLGKFPLKRGEKGIWSGKASVMDFQIKSFDGHYYQLLVKAYGKENRVLDPYAKSMAAFDPNDADSVGKAAIVDLSRFAKAKRTKVDQANEVDYIGYEAHIRDFTIDPSLKIHDQLRGTYQGFKKVVPYLKGLGITHVQFLPLQNFYTVKETNKRYQGSDVLPENMNYNWGYDPHNYFTPEGWYSTDATDPYARLIEVRDLVQTMHDNGIGVILDVVYNHTFRLSILEDAAPGLYMRRNDDGYISYASGAGASVESRNKMSRKLIIDSLKHWKDFFGVDGFRFDLMGFLDRGLMSEIRKELGDDIILYGEAWEFTDLPTEIATTKSNMPSDAFLSAFNDSVRDSYTGRMSDKGFIQGVFNETAKVTAGIIGGIKDYPEIGGFIGEDSYDRFADIPMNALNFLTIHDGFTLWDKINLTVRGSQKTRMQYAKMAHAMLFASQGRLILHGGSELGRSKPLMENDPNPDRGHTSVLVNQEDKVDYFHENSYKSPDNTNGINWKRAKDFEELTAYVKGLIELRRKAPAFRFKESASIVDGLNFVAIPEELLNLEVEGSAGYESFKDPGLSSLTVEFTNAPRNVRGKTLYFAGEVHPQNASSKNPVNNRFSVKIDKKGNGKAVFRKQDILNFDLGAWAKANSLQFKLVTAPGEWTIPTGSYSNQGNNTVLPENILIGNRVEVDLSIKDHIAGYEEVEFPEFIAFELDNTLETDMALSLEKLPYEKFIVVFNGDLMLQALTLESLDDPTKWDILVDGENAGVTPLQKSKVIVGKNFLRVPKKSVVVIGKRAE